MDFIYRFFGDYGECLYVGQTNDIKRRFKQHMKKEWWPEVGRIDVAEVEQKRFVDIYEKYYINKLEAKYNKRDTKIRYNKFCFPELEFFKYYT